MSEIPVSYYMGRVIAFMLISSGCTHNEIKKILSIAEQQVDAVPYGCDDLLTATGLSPDTIMDVATKMIKDFATPKAKTSTATTTCIYPGGTATGSYGGNFKDNHNKRFFVAQDSLS